MKSKPSDETEKEFFARYAKATGTARTQLRKEIVFQYRGLVEAYVRWNWYMLGEDMDELTQVLYLHVLNDLVDKYDRSQKVPFSAYMLTYLPFEALKWYGEYRNLPKAVDMAQLPEGQIAASAQLQREVSLEKEGLVDSRLRSAHQEGTEDLASEGMQEKEAYDAMFSLLSSSLGWSTDRVRDWLQSFQEGTNLLWDRRIFWLAFGHHTGVKLRPIELVPLRASMGSVRPIDRESESDVYERRRIWMQCARGSHGASAIGSDDTDGLQTLPGA